MNEKIAKYASDAFNHRKEIIQNQSQKDPEERIVPLCESIFNFFVLSDSEESEKRFCRIRLLYQYSYIELFFEDKAGSVYSEYDHQLPENIIGEIRKFKEIDVLSEEEFCEDLYHYLKDLPNYMVEKDDLEITIKMNDK